jgi:hypothetical protein
MGTWGWIIWGRGREWGRGKSEGGRGEGRGTWGWDGGGVYSKEEIEARRGNEYGEGEHGEGRGRLGRGTWGEWAG